MQHILKQRWSGCRTLIGKRTENRVVSPTKNQVQGPLRPTVVDHVGRTTRFSDRSRMNTRRAFSRDDPGGVSCPEKNDDLLAAGHKEGFFVVAYNPPATILDSTKNWHRHNVLKKMTFCVAQGTRRDFSWWRTTLVRTQDRNDFFLGNIDDSLGRRAQGGLFRGGVQPTRAPAGQASSQPQHDRLRVEG